MSELDEPTALRRVAELVARATPAAEIFSLVSAQASWLLGGQAVTLTRFDGPGELIVEASTAGPAQVGERIVFAPGTLPDRVRTSAAVVRVDDCRRERDATMARTWGIAAAVSAPVVVAGRVWGMVTATADAGPLPAGTEERLEQFTQLAAAAVGNSQARAELQALADEQAAVRRVTELCARGASEAEVLHTVASEGSRLSGVGFAAVLRYEAGGVTQVLAVGGAPDGVVTRSREPSTEAVARQVWRTGRAARVDDLAGVGGRPVASGAGRLASLAVPVLCEGRLWGALIVVSRARPLPRDIEGHLADLADVVGTAISATEARRQLRALADEHAALRRVAELVARGAAPDEVFVTVADEASALLGDHAVALMLYDDAGARVVATRNCPAPVGFDVPFSAGTAVDRMTRTGRPVRVETYANTPLADATRALGISSTAAVPIAIEGHIRAALVASTAGPPLPEGTEARLAQFAELAAVAIANAETKAKLTASRARVVATADETRRRLQRDVHDGAQQRLVHAIIALKLARDAVPAGSPAAELVAEALANAERASKELRDVVHGILPASLTRQGLHAGLMALVDDLALPVDARISVPRLPPATETTAYFVVAEALTNVVKHARAERATLHVHLEGATLVLEIRDDGLGGADPAHGSGLAGLFDRVEAAEGRLTITSPVGIGTRVRVELPGVVDRAAAPGADAVATP